MSLSASDYSDFTRIMALYKLHYLLTYCKMGFRSSNLPIPRGGGAGQCYLSYKSFLPSNGFRGCTSATDDIRTDGQTTHGNICRISFPLLFAVFSTLLSNKHGQFNCYTVMFISSFSHVRLSLDNKRLLTYLISGIAFSVAA